MRFIPDPDRRLAQITAENRENDFQHHGYGEEMKQDVMMQRGDPEAVEESERMLLKSLSTTLSQDPLRNIQYHFMVIVTIAARFAIAGGMEAETAYNISDMYIFELDRCQTVDDVRELHQEMFACFTARMTGVKKEKVLSRPIAQCVDYIEANLRLPLRINDLADLVSLSPGYLSSLFKTETGRSFTDYVLDRRIAAAEDLLRYSDHSLAEISDMTGFSSQSYFIHCFREQTGVTPREYRLRAEEEAIPPTAEGEAAEPDPD